VKPLAFSILSLLAASFAFAQNKITEEIVVTASALPETVGSTPAAVTVVTKKDIDRRAARDLADILREVPGLTVSRSGSPGKATSLFTRGAASTQTLVMWNGIEINNPYFAGYDWGRFSTAGVEQVEVVRGPFSALYGSEAMAGVVNVLSTSNDSGVRGELQIGGRGLRNAALSGSYAGTSTQVNAAYEHRQDDGFDTNDDFRQNSASIFFKFAPSPTFSLGLGARHTAYDLGIPFDVNAAGTALLPSLQRRQNGTELQVAVPLEKTFGPVSYDLTLSESRRRDDFNDPEDPFGIVSSSTESASQRARLTMQGQTSIGTLIGGGEWQRARVDDRSNFGVNLANNRRDARSLFLEDRWRSAGQKHLELSAGVRYDRFDTFGSQTSPRVAAAWIAGRNKLRLAYGEGFRAPSVGELYFPFSGNRDLRPEHSRSVEAGYDAAVGVDGLLSVTLFSSRFRDLINFDNRSFLFGNIGRARSDGLELGMQAHVTRSVYAALSYTYLHRDEDELTGERLLRRPKHGGSAFLGWRSGPIEANVALIRSGARVDLLPIAPYSHVINGPYTTVDLNLQFHSGAITPFAKIENLRNARYQEVFGYVSPGRRTIVGLRFER
jgi:vitamin B12 transporter